ncbi:MAG: hypothetical protein LBC85_01065 [Fibromonadaceae bacterium]|jgi:hypothetical protein|nr:hypothetical protein [Fibromonadaceae bacterium]
MTKLLKTAFVFLLCLASLSISAVNNPTGEARRANAADFFRHPQQSNKYNEMWSYVFVFDNGTRAYVNYTWMYVPTQGFRIGTDFSVWNFKGKSYSVGRQYSTDRFVENKSANRININNNDYIMENTPGAGHRLVFSANKSGERFLDLTFTSAVSGMVPGNGEFTVNGEKFGLVVHIPHGRVRGRLGVGKDTIEVQGYGYMDQVWQTEKPTEMAARMVTLSMPSSKTFIAGRIGITRSGLPFGYAIHHAEGTSKIVFANSVLEDGNNYNPRRSPKNLTFVWNDENVPPLKFDATPQEIFSILANFEGFLERNVVKLALGDLRYRRGRSATELGRLDWVIAGF